MNERGGSLPSTHEMKENYEASGKVKTIAKKFIEKDSWHAHSEHILISLLSSALWSRKTKNPEISTGPSVCLFARTAHLFARSALLAALMHSAVLTHELARSLTPSLVGK